jgi:putative MFS transporter
MSLANSGALPKLLNPQSPRWSSIKTLVLFIALTTMTLLAFVVMSVTGTQSTTAMVIATALLLVSASGVIAILIPYAAEIYPVHLRATGSGMIAASSKLGGIFGAAFGVLGVFSNIAASAALRSGIDTRGRRLEDIQDAVSRKSASA